MLPALRVRLVLIARYPALLALTAKYQAPKASLVSPVSLGLTHRFLGLKASKGSQGLQALMAPHRPN